MQARWSAVAGVLVSAWLGSGCFNSDEVFKVASAETEGPSTTTNVTAGTWTTTASVDDTSTGAPMGDDTCQDAIQCVQSCIFALATSNLPEPDLSCFLECTQTLSELEALKLLRLGNCISNQCVVYGQCEGPSDDTTGGSTDTGSESSDSSGSSSSGEDGGGNSGGGNSGGGNSGGNNQIDACLWCILTGMLDPAPEGCLDYANDCRGK